MLALLKRWKLETADRFKCSSLVRGAAGQYLGWTAGTDGQDQQALVRSIVKLCAAARYTTKEARIRAIQRTLQERVGALRPREVDWSPFVKQIDHPGIHRALLLKPCLGPRERGVMYVSFEIDWFKLLWHCDLRAFSDRYDLVVSPSSSPHNILSYVFAGSYPGRIYSLISNHADIADLPHVASNHVVVPLYASQWVLPELFQPRPLAERDIDLIMVANFAKVKRHIALFSALRKLPARFRVHLIGQDQDGRTAQTLHEEAGCYGVARRFTVQSNARYHEVAGALCRARASVILSRREGSCVVVTESMFANTPVGLLEDAEIGSRAFINQATGRFLKHHDLAVQLADLIERAGEFSPRAWAEQNIDCFHSSRTLNDALQQHAQRDGRDWTQDLAALCWRPDPELVRREDVLRLQAEREDVKKTFGIDVGPRLI
jgi:glycosyltransferase involved in cell wall biosynthesis